MNKLKIKLKMNTTKFIKGNWQKVHNATQHQFKERVMVHMAKTLIGDVARCRASGVTIESILNLLV